MGVQEKIHVGCGDPEGRADCRLEMEKELNSKVSKAGLVASLCILVASLSLLAVVLFTGWSRILDNSSNQINKNTERIGHLETCFAGLQASVSAINNRLGLIEGQNRDILKELRLQNGHREETRKKLTRSGTDD